MNTNGDYLFSKNLQSNFVDLTNNEDHVPCIDLTNTTAGISISEFETNSKKRMHNNVENTNQSKIIKDKENIVDQSWETLDPNPDIHCLFLTFNKQYFWNTLDKVVIQWSKRMTLCAGLCRYENGFCSISLSEPLLKLRPRKDLVETLLHEMIHAYLFLTNNKEHKNRDGHGSSFCKHMYRINMKAGTNISIYHDFYEEVKSYKQHWWKCNGPCQNKKPFYGYVKRSINRAPGSYDKWWASHQFNCGGSFIKVKEPEGYGLKKKINSKVPKKLTNHKNKITNFIEVLDLPTKKVSESSEKIKSVKSDKEIDQQDKICLDTVDEMIPCPICSDMVLKNWLNSHLENCSQLKEWFGNIDDECECPVCHNLFNRHHMNEHLDSCEMLSNIFENDHVVIPDNQNYVNCPNCTKTVKECNINEHLDICISLSPNAIDISLDTTLNNAKDEVNSIVKCPCCNNTFNNVIELDYHIDNCA